MKSKLMSACARIWKDKSGGVMVYTAIALPVLLGVSGLSVDIGGWYADRRAAQVVADAGALAGAVEILRTGADDDDTNNGSDVQAAALASALENGYDTSEGDNITINYPPTSGAYAGSGEAIEVVVTRPAEVYVAGMLFDEPVTVAARSVALGAFNDTCIWALSTTAPKAVKASGGAEVNLPCGIFSNSGDPDSSLSTDGGACITASQIKAAGPVTGDCIDPTPIANANPVNDPFESLEPPTYGGCDVNSPTNVNSGTVTVTPGTYCGQIRVNAGATLIFEPGLYVLDGAALTFNANSTVIGDGVTFYLTEDSGQGDNISIAANANVTLSAPDDGDMAGVLFYQDRDSPTNITHSFTGQSTMNLEGILYFPNQGLNFAGGTQIDPVSTLIVTDTISFTGDTTVDNFDGSSIENLNPLLVTVTIVE